MQGCLFDLLSLICCGSEAPLSLFTASFRNSACLRCFARVLWIKCPNIRLYAFLAHLRRHLKCFKTSFVVLRRVFVGVITC